MKKKLQQAAREGTLIRLWRDEFESGPMPGYVVAVGAEWFLLSYIGEEITFSGFTALRVRDVTEVESPHHHRAFVEKALEMKGLKRPDDPDIDLSGTGALVMSAGRVFPLVSIHCEIEDPDTCQIGMPVQVQAGSVSLKEIDANAVWYDDVEFYRLGDITRVDFGGGYEEALMMVGGRN